MKDSPLSPLYHLAYDYEGAEVRFKCHSLVEVTWIHNNVHLKDKVRKQFIPADTYTITIPTIESSDEGEYICKGKALHRYVNESAGLYNEDMRVLKDLPYKGKFKIISFQASAFLIVGGE